MYVYSVLHGAVRVITAIHQIVWLKLKVSSVDCVMCSKM